MHCSGFGVFNIFCASGAAMRVYRLRLFGFEVGSWEVDGDSADLAEVVAEALAGLIADDDDTPDDTSDDTPEPAAIAGAGTHNFERDLEPRYPEADKDYDTWIPRPFGFHR